MTSDDYSKLLEELLTHKLYSVQALAYPNDTDLIQDSARIRMDVAFPLFRKLDAGTYFTLQFVVRPPKDYSKVS